MSNIEKYENLVIGSGGAGKFVAWTMADAGRRTAMVEQRALGGACPNVACLPSKNIIYSAKVISLARRGAEFGLKTDSFGVDMKAVQRRKRLMVEGLHQMHLDRTNASGAELIMGNARFVAPRTVEVDLRNGGTRTIFGDRVFLDLGSRATIPELPGLVAANPMTHVEALDLDRLPEHLIVLGGGYVGLELAQAIRRFGSQVTLIEAGPQLAAREDPDIGAALKDMFVDEGIEVLLETEVRQVEGRSSDRVQVHANDRRGKRTIEGTDLLVATGRQANTDGLNLELTGVHLDVHGYVKVNDRLMTASDNIWAMGDCAGSPQFTHVAFDDFRIVHDNLNGGNRTTKNRLIPFCMFTDPELARVGRNESEAQREGIEYRLVKMPMGDVLRTRTVSERRGLMKMLIAKDSDEILGFTAFGFEASEQMVAVQTAMIGHLPYTILRDAILTHPTMSEGLNELLANVPANSTRAPARRERPGAVDARRAPGYYEVMEIGKHGLWFFLDGMTAPQSAEFARKVEKLGYSALWIPEAVGREPFAHSGYLAAKTDKLIFATGIANIWARDPITMSAASKTVGELSGGRFVLGIGVSHKPLVLNLRGHSYDKPYSYMKEYLPKLKSAMYRAPMPKEEVPILIAALHPRMLALAAAEAQGTHTYFVPPEHTAQTRAAIGPKPWICAAQAVILENDATKARAAARTYMKTYVPRLPNYTNNLKNLGWKDEDFANGCSDALVDAIVAWGSETKIRDRIDAHLKAGATHVCILPVKVDSESLPDERAMEALAPK